jgi:hypothetical protein
VCRGGMSRVLSGIGLLGAVDFDEDESTNVLVTFDVPEAL